MSQRKNAVKEKRMTDLVESGSHVGGSGGSAKLLQQLHSASTIGEASSYNSWHAVCLHECVCACMTYVPFYAPCEGCQGVGANKHVSENKSASLEPEIDD